MSLLNNSIFIGSCRLFLFLYINVKMISLIKLTFDKFVNLNDSKEEPKELSGNLDSIVAELEGLATKKDEEQTNKVDDDEGDCLRTTGTVTLVTDSYIIIEKKYMCEERNVVPKNLKAGDKVEYLAYKVKADGELKIRKILNITENSWGDNENSTSEWNETSNHSTDAIIKKFQIFERNMVGKVIERNGRIIKVHPDITFNLNDVKSEFIPMIGDWLKLKCLVECDEKQADFVGEVLEVKEIQPLRSNIVEGKVTMYNEEKSYGVIDKIIIFSKDVCGSGYIPCEGDSVATNCIESEQSLYKWRALNVVPTKEVESKFIYNELVNIPDTADLKELLSNKNGVEITDDLDFELNPDEETKIEVKISNNSSVDVQLVRCIIRNGKDSQVTLVKPKRRDQVTLLKPTSWVNYEFRCTGKIVGMNEELVTFDFVDFKIGRMFNIQVNSLNVKNEDQVTGITFIHTGSNKRVEIPKPFESGMYIPGIKPYDVPKFIKHRPVRYPVPTKYEEVIATCINERKTHSETEYYVMQKIPCLESLLTYKNYIERFDALLYLEQIAQRLHIDQYQMKSAIMRHCNEYLSLNVPGLAEKRPSLIVGDRITVTFKWSTQFDKQKTYEGYIHKIRSCDVYLKFDQKFHENYHGEDCQVKFICASTVINRCHTAIKIVYNNLGEEILFPKKVVQKEPQYNFIEVEENEESEESVPMANNSLNSRMLDINASLKKRKLSWINKKLNVYQKEAVKNILKGLARPLPYVIFGPPGTGKTMTLCETILQILCTISESRILVATPSNSSANLITEKLIESQILKPGDLVRLVAHHYLESINIPASIFQYCATAELAAEGSKTSNVNVRDHRGCTLNSTFSVLGRHRITVGTCAALGILHNMGFPKDHFTHVLIDEAGQATEPEIMIPLSLVNLRTGQIVLAGDPQQLGPITLSRLAGYFGLGESYLTRLLQQFPYQKDPQGFIQGYDPRLVTKLLYNYRSLPELLELPNRLFYDSELQAQLCPEDSEEAQILYSLREILPKRLGCPPAITFIGLNGKNMQDEDSPSWYNSEEATQAFLYLKNLYNCGIKAEDIGIITPYEKQVRLIRQIISDYNTDCPKVGSVEEFQGQEKLVIILSTVRSEGKQLKKDIRHALGFVSAPKRLNVAITRARALLIIIGNPFLLQEDYHWRNVIEYCCQQGAYSGVKFEPKKNVSEQIKVVKKNESELDKLDALDKI